MCSRTTPDVHKLQTAGAITVNVITIHTATSTHAHRLHKTPPVGALPSTPLLLIRGSCKWRPLGQESIFPDLSMLKRRKCVRNTYIQTVSLASPELCTLTRVQGIRESLFYLCLRGSVNQGGLTSPPAHLKKAPPQVGSRQGRICLPKEEVGRRGRVRGGKSPRISCWEGTHS